MTPSKLPAIRTVLAAYRSTNAVITQEQIEAAWAEHAEAEHLEAEVERLRADLGVADDGVGSVTGPWFLDVCGTCGWHSLAVHGIGPGQPCEAYLDGETPEHGPTLRFAVERTAASTAQEGHGA